jgi:hypothetical protein
MGNAGTIQSSGSTGFVYVVKAAWVLSGANIIALLVAIKRHT